MARPEAHVVAADIRRTRAIFRPKRPMWRKRLPRQLEPTGIKLEYWKALRLYVERARTMVHARVLPALSGIVAGAAAERGDRMDRGAEANKLIDEISKAYFDDLRPQEIERLAARFADRTIEWQSKEMRKQVRAAFGVDVFAAEPRLAGRVADFTAENVALIKSIPNGYFDDVEKTITRGVSSGLRHEEIAKDLERRYEISRDRAKLIARDQVGKFYGAVNEARQTAMGVKQYVWRTVNDERVRDEHAAREGDTFTWDDPPEDGSPGQAINCRCFAEPDFSEILDNL